MSVSMEASGERNDCTPGMGYHFCSENTHAPGIHWKWLRVGFSQGIGFFLLQPKEAVGVLPFENSRQVAPGTVQPASSWSIDRKLCQGCFERDVLLWNRLYSFGQFSCYNAYKYMCIYFLSPQTLGYACWKIFIRARVFFRHPLKTNSKSLPRLCTTFSHRVVWTYVRVCAYCSGLCSCTPVPSSVCNISSYM